MSAFAEEQARACERRADEEPAERVQQLCEAAEYWHMSGSDDRARELFERIVVEPDRATGDQRVAFARFLLDVGEPERARGLLDEVWHSRDLDGFAYQRAGEAFERRLGEPAAALRWYTRGIVRLAGPDSSAGAQDDAWIELLMGARHRVRRELGEPADEWDELWEASRRDGQGTADSDAAADADATSENDESPRPVGAVPVLYWPPDELAEYRRRWPEADPTLHGVADPDTAHRREVEAALRRYPQMRMLLVKGTVAGLAERAEAQGSSPDDASTTTAYALELARHGTPGDVLPWPPARNETCWCGSGRKYKKCCGAPGFVETT